MINGFINNQKTVMASVQFMNRDGGILGVMFLKIQRQLFADLFGKNRGRNPGRAFGKLHKHAVINVVVNQHNEPFCRAQQIIHKNIRIKNLSVKKDALHRLFCGLFQCPENQLEFFICF